MKRVLGLSALWLDASIATRFAFAVGCVALAWVARWALDPYLGNSQPFSTFFVATTLIAWWGGWKLALGAAALGFFLGDWSFMDPRDSFGLSPSGWIDLGVYWVVSGTSIWLINWARVRERQANGAIDSKQEVHALEEAKETEQARRIQMEALLQAVPVAVWIGHDPECRVLNGNPAAYGILELPVGANLSMSAPECERPHNYHFVKNGRVLTSNELPIQSAARTGVPVLGTELEIHFKDGRLKWILGNAVPLTDSQGTVWGAVGAFMEITGQKQLESELRKAKESLSSHNEDLEKAVEERTKELKYFSYSITHDMRAPLRAMQGYSQLLLNERCFECPKPEAKEYLRRIMTAAVRLDALIMDALSYNDLTRSELAIGPVDVAALLREILESYPNIQLQLDAIKLEGSFPPVLGNRAALTQCFSNLLGNAIKFADPNKKLQIRVWAENLNGLVRLWVEDNGIGIAPEWQSRIFEMFQTVNAGEEGTGIGLALVRKAVQKMGGQVGVESELSKGSRFWLQLPLAQC